MQIFKCKAYPEYEIVAYSYETRNSWGHKATLIRNGTHELNRDKITYYNRTWEKYRYQSVAMSVVQDYIDSLVDEYINDYKSQHNIKRLQANQKQQLKLEAYKSTYIEPLIKFINELEKGEY